MKSKLNKIGNLLKHDIDQIEVGDDLYIMIDKGIKVIEYAPDVFAQLRDLDGFNNESLKNSLDPIIEGNVKNMFKAGEGMGRSGSFFFFSHDDRFLIKTMTNDDY